MGHPQNQGQSQGGLRYMLISPHDPITYPESAATRPFVPILLPEPDIYYVPQAQVHGDGGHGHVPFSPNNSFNAGPGGSGNVNGRRSPFTPTTSAPSAPPGPGGHCQTQHPQQQQQQQPHEHRHQYKIMEVVPMSEEAQDGQPLPGYPGYVFRPAAEPEVPVPPAPAPARVPAPAPAPAPSFQVSQPPSYIFQAQPHVQPNDLQDSFFAGSGTLWIMKLELLDEASQSNLSQENSQIDSSGEETVHSEEKPPAAWAKSNCIFCRSNGEPPSVYTSHHLKDDQTNKTVCPILMQYTCPICKKTGEEAHTLKYCPQKPKPKDAEVASPSPSVPTGPGNNIHVVKQVLNSTGKSYRLKY